MLCCMTFSAKLLEVSFIPACRGETGEFLETAGETFLRDDKHWMHFGYLGRFRYIRIHFFSSDQ